MNQCPTIGRDDVRSPVRGPIGTGGTNAPPRPRHELNRVTSDAKRLLLTRATAIARDVRVGIHHCTLRAMLSLGRGESEFA